MGKKLRAVALALACACLAPFAFAGCGPKDPGGGGDIGEDGEYIPKPDSKEAQVKFWISGDDIEIEVFKKLVDDFNSQYKGLIKVNMAQKTSSGYEDMLSQSLGGGSAADVFYVGDSGYKNYAEKGYLLDITDYISKSQSYKIEDMWSNVVTRYKYDVNTYLSGTESGRYYGVPKDIGPTVIYYNETYFKGAGITVISVAAEDLEKFNGGNFADDKGNTKNDLKINGEVKEKGFFNLGGKWYFNNQVPMSWEETVACAQMVQTYMRNTLKIAQGYGYFTEWWFNYGWSVGGNCIQQIPSDLYDCGYYYDFTLMDGTKNYIVADDVEEVTVNGKKYTEGQIIDYKDKIDMSAYAGHTTADGAANYGKYVVTEEVKTLKSEGKLNELPSQREAFAEFLRIGPKTNAKGETILMDKIECYGIAPRPTDVGTDGSDAGKISEFEWGNFAMLVDGRWDVTSFRKNIKDFEWDVAPLPMYKKYYEEGDEDIPAGKEVGDIKVHGIEAGHSGSVALCISKNSKVAPEAWKFIEFVGGTEGQTLQAEAGFAIPLQKNLANSPVFLQTDKAPKNSKVFIRATEYEQAGDWWFLQDKKWIDGWAGILNDDVRNGKITLSDFYAHEKYKNTFTLLEKYTKNG